MSFFPPIPRLLDSIDPVALFQRLKERQQNVMRSSQPNITLFVLKDDDTSQLVRACQELPLLKTRVEYTRNGHTELLPSFYEVWTTPMSPLPMEICESDDVHEAKWTLQRKYGYRLATTFMTAIATSLYDHFLLPLMKEKEGNTLRVLDPCAGWGDRMMGLVAFASSMPSTIQYVGFDPNLDLYEGYEKMMQYAGISRLTDDVTDVNGISFDNGFEIHAQPYEVGAVSLQDATFDFAFTSPPFFQFEVYNERTNPSYKDWINEFYVPLFCQTARLLKNNAYFVVYIGDTSAGKITDFLHQRVHQICSLVPCFQEKQIGFRGLYSGKIRSFYVFQNRK